MPMSQNNDRYRCPVDQPRCDLIEQLNDLQQRTTELETQVHTDALTGLINYRGFEECLEQEMERTRRLEEPTSLIMIDIDHFKRVNDTHGHDIGNLALIHIADLLRGQLRKLDIPCRFGGEEFVVILPSTRLAPAVQVAERIRRRIEKTSLPLERKKLSLTISLGVETFAPLDNLSVAEVLKNADTFLYQAKHTGRNCTCHPPIDLSGETGAVSSKEKQDLFAAFGRKKT